MTRLGPARFALVAGAVALAAAVPAALAAGSYGPVALRFCLGGWLVTALTGVAGGAWLVSRHGMTGAPFLVALATCMLSRLILAAAGAVFAATRGDGGADTAVFAWVAGLVAGYLPVQVVEMIWFQRRTALAQRTHEVTSR